MADVVGVRFKNAGKVYTFDANGLEIQKGDAVIVETARGIEYGEVTVSCHPAQETEVVAPLRKVIRLATKEDQKTMEKNRERERRAIETCQKKIVEHKLEMKCIDVEQAFDGSKLLFYFTADGRVDFRDLVRDLAGIFKTRIELRQVGVRDEAKMLGGLGICGRPFCCASFLDDFQPVSIKMAKEQNLSLNPTKISGTCGRLMCCLKYEQEAYEDLNRTTPRVGSLVETPQGMGTIVEVSLLSGNLKVRMDEATDTTLKSFHKSEITVKRAPQRGQKGAKHPEIPLLAEPSVESQPTPSTTPRVKPAAPRLAPTKPASNPNPKPTPKPMPKTPRPPQAPAGSNEQQAGQPPMREGASRPRRRRRRGGGGGAKKETAPSE